jgi:hypothetical protein
MNPSNSKSRTKAKAAAELKLAHGVVTVKRPRRCSGCGTLNTKVNPNGGCLACGVRHTEVTTPPKMPKRRVVPDVYCPTIYTWGVQSGRAAG